MMLSFGNRLKQIRQERELSQSELARRLLTSSRMLLRWEKDEVKPSADALVKLSRILGVSTDELLGLSQPAEPVLHEITTLATYLSLKNQKIVLKLLRALSRTDSE